MPLETKNPFLVPKELAARHCFGAVGTAQGEDRDEYNVSCVFYGLRPTAILHRPDEQPLRALKDLKLSVVPILETHGDSNSVVVYNAANGESIVKAKLLALLGTSDTRSYSPGDKLIFENGN